MSRKEKIDFVGGFICCISWLVLTYFVILFLG